MKRWILVIATATLLSAQNAPGPLELFLLIGQSNMAGRGVIEEQDRQPIARVTMVNQAMDWVPAVDPVHFDKPDIAGVGLARSFAKVLAAADPKATIGLIPAAISAVCFLIEDNSIAHGQWPSIPIVAVENTGRRAGCGVPTHAAL